MGLWKKIILLALCVPTIAQAHSNVKLFDVKQYHKGKVVLLTNDYGTNIGIISSKTGLLLIDPMPGGEALNDLENWIKTHTPKPVLYVANTHQHNDHTGGNTYFKNKGAEILNLTGHSLNSGSALEFKVNFKTFGLKAFNVTSHTDKDHLYFHAKSNMLFVGDVFDNSWHPTFYAGGIKGFTKTIEKILSIGDEHTLVVPGHGLPANKTVVKAFYNNTLVWLTRMSELVKEGLTVEQMMADKKLNEILQRFNTEKKQEFLPQRAFKRFIERTITIVGSSQWQKYFIEVNR